MSAGLATEAGGAGWLDASVLQRLLFDVFQEDVSLFKGYCLEVGLEGLLLPDVSCMCTGWDQQGPPMQWMESSVRSVHAFACW